MKYRRCAFVMASALLAVFALSSTASADFFFKMVNNTDAVQMMGQTQPATSDTSSIWLTDGKSCMTSPDGNSYLFIEKDNKAYFIDRAAKTYAEMPLDLSEQVADAMEEVEDEEGAEQAAMMKAMTEQMAGSFKITVTPSAESKKIGDWQATKYIMDMTTMMGKMTSELWATEDIKVDYDAYLSVANGSSMMLPGYEQMLREMKKVKGIVVYSVAENAVMGSTVRSTMELLEFSEKKAPAGTFDIPE
ncbi:MAG: hypothetical protein JSW34_05980, partial [Candidatus Zixiibacteriota bacterium]